MIETPKLMMRRWENKDIYPYFLINQNQMVMKYFSRSMSLKEIENLLEELNHHYSEYGYTLMALEHRETNKLIGYAGFSNFDFHPCLKGIDIGILLDTPYWRQGLATEAAFGCLNYALERFDDEKIFAYTCNKNERAIRLLEKIGMQREKEGDFKQPNLNADHFLSQQITYGITLKRGLNHDASLKTQFS